MTFYKRHKQAIENYHKDLKNRFNIRKLPSRKFYPICVYFMMVIIIYMLVWFVGKRYKLRMSCGFIFFMLNKCGNPDEFECVIARMSASCPVEVP